MQVRTHPFQIVMLSRKRLLTAVLLGFWSSLGASESPDPYAAAQANLAVTSVRLTDDGDNDGHPDPNETVQVYVTLRNRAGSDRQGVIVRMGSTDPTVACIPTPVVSFGALLGGEVREATVPLVQQVLAPGRVHPRARRRQVLPPARPSPSCPRSVRRLLVDDRQPCRGTGGRRKPRRGH